MSHNPQIIPYKHQEETAKFLLQNKHAYVFNDIGTGKTISCLLACDSLFEANKITKVLVISPLSTMQSVWRKEIARFLIWPTVAIAHGSAAKRLAAIRSGAHFILINPDGVTSSESYLKAAKFDVIIIDEVTVYKNSQAKRSKAMQRISATSVAVWALSGNPTPNSHVEAFGVAKVTNPNNPFLPKYLTKFRQLVETQIGPFITIPTPQADDIVFKVLQPAIRFTRDECIDLPECQYEDITIPMDPEQLRAYKEMRDELLYEYESGEITSANAAVKFSKLLQIASGAVKDDEGHVLHLPCKSRDDVLLNIFNETGRTKLIIFCAFRAGIEHVLEVFKKFRVAAIHGDVNQNRRSMIINDFTDGDLQVLVLQPQAASHGLNLQNCNTIVWHSLIASGELYEQCNGRIIRAGQTRRQLIIHLISSKAEKRMLGILSRKAKLSEEILGLFTEI